MKKRILRNQRDGLFNVSNNAMLDKQENQSNINRELQNGSMK